MLESSEKVRILLVEDQTIIALAESKTLRDAGFAVEIVHTGEEALRVAAERDDIDLVLMDIDLGPGMDGTEAAERILEVRTLPIVFLTSHAEQEVVEKVKGITRYGYVLKNSGRFVLIESIQMALELFSAHRTTAIREKQILKISRTYGVLSDVNQAIVRMQDPRELLPKVCEIAVDRGDFLLAWIGVPDAEGRRIVSATSYGPQKSYVSDVTIDLFDPLTAEGQTGTAYTTGRRVVFNDIATAPRMARWKDKALSRGFRASAAFPIRVSGTVKGVFNLYASAVGFFDEEEIRLLDELAADIGFALEVDESNQRRRRAEASRDWWEYLLRYVIQYDPSAIAVHDRELRYLFVSDRYLSDYNVSEKEIIGRHHYEVFPDIPEKWREVHRRALEGEILESQDDFYVNAAGHTVYTRWKCRPWYDAEGEIGGIILYTEVITAERQLRREHKRTLAALESLVRNSPDPVSIVDSSGRWMVCSESVAGSIGKTSDELKDRRFADLLPRDIAEEFDRSVRRVVDTGEGFTKEEWISTPTADRFYKTTLFPAQFVEGRVELVGVVSVDLTESVHATRRIEASESKYRNVIDFLSFGFWITDGEGIIQEANPACEAITGYTPEELVGMSVTEVDVGETPEGVAFRVESMRHSGFFEFETTYRRKDGSTVPVVVRTNRLSQKEDTFFGIVEDVSRRRAAEHQAHRLMEEKELLLRENRHRLKNDLQTIHGLLSLQADRAVGSGASEALLEAAGRVETMAHLYDKLHRSEGLSGSIDAEALLEDLIEDIADRYDGTGPTIGFHGDALTMSQNAVTPLGIIVNELVTNAIKHAFREEAEKPRSDEPRVEVSLIAEAEGHARLTVADNGAGAPAPVLGGTADGFGLTLVRSFVGQLRGTLSILRNDDYRGTRVEIRFPVTDALSPLSRESTP
ncbi:MAG: PAS domain-containing protein [Spirochaetaceae bacterium]